MGLTNKGDQENGNNMLLWKGSLAFFNSEEKKMGLIKVPGFELRGDSSFSSKIKPEGPVLQVISSISDPYSIPGYYSKGSLSLVPQNKESGRIYSELFDSNSILIKLELNRDRTEKISNDQESWKNSTIQSNSFGYSKDYLIFLSLPDNKGRLIILDSQWTPSVPSFNTFGSSKIQVSDFKLIDHPLIFESSPSGLLKTIEEAPDAIYPAIPKSKTYNDETWEEKNFLKFLAHHTKLKKEAESSEVRSRKSSEEFVILEAAELLKFFNSDGTAKNKDSNTEILVPKKQNCSDLKELSSKLLRSKAWPEVTSTNALGIHYNLTESSEINDKASMQTLKTFIGLIRETSSTCHVLNSSTKPDIFDKPKKQEPKQSKKSSNNVKPPLQAEQIFKQKIRNAVFNILSEKGIDVSSKLFRPCFQKLFNICKMYAKKKPHKGSTKEWLYKVALKNVDPVISLEQSLIN